MLLPNHTQVSNQFLDEVMAQAPASSVLCFLAICRKTIGWQKTSDKISYSQLKKLTGLSNDGIRDGTEWLEKYALIAITRTKGRPNRYDVNFTAEQRGAEIDLTAEQRGVHRSAENNLTAEQRDKRKKETRQKIKYEERVFLKPGEYELLCFMYNQENANQAIIILDNWLANGKKRTDHFACIQQWVIPEKLHLEVKSKTRHRDLMKNKQEAKRELREPEPIERMENPLEDLDPRIRSRMNH